MIFVAYVNAGMEDVLSYKQQLAVYTIFEFDCSLGTTSMKSLVKKSKTGWDAFGRVTNSANAYKYYLLYFMIK